MVHEGCRKVLREHFTLEPVRNEAEGSRVSLPVGFDATRNRVTGNVVGEPPFNLAISVWCAILDALKALAPGRLPPLDAPATPEAVLKAVAALKAGEGA